MLFISFAKTNLIVPLKYIHINATDSEIKNDFLSNLYSKNLYMNITIGSNKEVIKGIFGAIVTYLFGFLADFSGPRSAVVATILLKVILLFAVFLLFKTKRKNLKKANLSKS